MAERVYTREEEDMRGDGRSVFYLVVLLVLLHTAHHVYGLAWKSWMPDS
jgi:hypothetical protein